MPHSTIRRLGLAAALLWLPGWLPACFSDSSATPDAGFDVALPAMALLSVAPASEDFGTVQVGAQSAPAVVTATNSGTSSTGVLAMHLAGTDAGAFVLDSDGCTGQ